ncbi:MAG: DUF2080 family transposase-associated protein [Nanoarchaeota archaeon]|jgi:hypothetical protein|nr:DUF2080 family transposase-associated protein [Nanoarchaeota archaeon]
MNSRKIEELKRQLERLHSILGELGVSEEVMERKVKGFGNGAHIILPKEHMDKKVRVIVG